MNTRKTLIALTLAALSASAIAQPHDHTPACGHDDLVKNPALEMLSKARLDKAVANKAAPFTDAAVRTMATDVDSQNIIDVMVYVHPSYIEDLAVAQRFDENEKPIENGAQFMHQLLKDQVDKVNAAFAKNRVNSLYRVQYVHVLDTAIPTNGADGKYDEYENLFRCASGSENAATAYAQCNTAVFKRANSLFTQAGVDTFHFIRSTTASGDNIAGLASFFGGSIMYDGYRNEVAAMIGSGLLDDNIADYMVNYGSTTVHEVGHVLAANHPNEDTDGKGHQAHSCGKAYEGSPNNKPTVMGAGLRHLFYSDPAITVDGDVCGIAGQADNSDAVRTYAPVLAATNDKAFISTNFDFSERTLSVEAGSGLHTVRIQRFGDLTAPASVALMAVDGSAWEQRDFNFGWQEVHFAAGEAYGNFKFTALERDGKHNDTQFAVKMMYSTAGTITTDTMKVTLQSTDVPVIGAVTFQPTAYTVAENGGSVTLTINRTNGTDGEAVVKVATRSQTGVAGTDFTAINQQITFADGQESATFTVNITDNNTYQGDRTFAVDLTPVTSGLATGNTTATVTITDNETPPVAGGGGTGGGTGGGDSGGDSGGSFGFISLLAGMLVALRRKYQI